MKKYLMVMGVAACLIMLMAFQGSAVSVNIKSSARSIQVNSGIWNSAASAWLFWGNSIEVIDAGADATIDPPSQSGGTTGDDMIIAVKYVNYLVGGPYYGRFLIQNVPVSTGRTLYLRAWDSSTEADADNYGNSSTFVVPSGLLGVSDYYDVGPSGGWNLDGYDEIAFTVGTAKPAPNGPTGFTGAAEGTNGIRWAWNSLANASSYEVCYSTTGTIDVISYGTGINILVNGYASGNRPYARKVRARLNTGKLTAFSTPFTAYTNAIVPQADTAKAYFSETTGNFYVRVTWEAANSAGTEYYLHRVGQIPDLAANILLVGTEDASALLGNTIYTYEVRAANGNGALTAYSNRVFTKTPPAAPTLKTSNVTTSKITWSWGSPVVAGADQYNFYINGILEAGGITATVLTKEGLSACQSYEGKVRALNLNYGEGAAAKGVKWTLPVTPEIDQTSTVSNPSRSVRVDYLTDVNLRASYEIIVSTTQVGGYVVKEPGTTIKNPTITCDNAGTLYWFRVRAKNGEGIWSDYSTPASGTSGGGGSGGGNPVTISTVKFNGRRYIQGDVIPAKPIITAVVTSAADLDQDLDDVVIAVDYGTANEVRIPIADIVFEPAYGIPDAVLLKATFSQSITATPVSAHKITIILQNALGNQTTWSGDVTIMSGSVQVVGQVYNYPNPFKPMSGDPSKNVTKIAYSLNVDAPVTVMIYDITGQEMYRTSFSGGDEGGRAGVNQILWDGRSMFSQPVGNGMYLYKIISGKKVIGSGKLVVLD